MAAQPTASTTGEPQDTRRQSGATSSSSRTTPSTALLIEYYEGVSNKGSNQPSVRVRVNPYMSESHDQSNRTSRTSYVSPLPTRENTVIERPEEEDDNRYEEREEDTTTAVPSSNLDTGRGRQRSRVISGASSMAPGLAPVTVHEEEEEEEEEPLPEPLRRSIERLRNFSDPQSILPMSTSGTNDIVSSRQFQAIIASAIQELILPEIQAVRNELNAQAQLFHHQPGLNQVSNQATFGTSTSGLRKRSRSLTALDAPLHRRNSLSIGTTEGFQGEVVQLPPRPQSPNVPAAMEAESLLRADLRSELKITPPGTPANPQSEARASHRLSGFTSEGPHVTDPSSHSVFNLVDYKKRESHEERMAAAKARRAAEKRLREGIGEDIPENNELGEPPQDRTRFSMITDRQESERLEESERPESDIHDLIVVEQSGAEPDVVPDLVPPSRHSSHDREIAELKAQLDVILEHLQSSAADRTGRENDILAQLSFLAEHTHRSLQQLKDTIMEETNVTVGALSYNIERYVGRVVGPRPQPGKGIGKSASYPQDRRTVEHTGSPGPMRRTTTFFQGIGNALTPGPGRATREKREGMERLEAMMERVLEEVEMLKRMKNGARRKTNGEMFKGEMRSRLNPPEDAVTYIDEARGDAANRERGESDEERMDRIARKAQDYEEEKNKRAMMQTAVASETNIIRETSKEVRKEQEPLPEGAVPHVYPPGVNPADVRQQLHPLQIDQRTGQRFAAPQDGSIIQPVPLRPGVESSEDLPSSQSYVHGDDKMFTRQQARQSGDPASLERQRLEARMSQVQDQTRKISIKEPIGLPSTASEQPESGVLPTRLEDPSKQQQTRSWIDGQAVPPPATPPDRLDEYQSRYDEAMRNPQPSTSAPLQTEVPQRQRSQYFEVDQFGRRQYYLSEFRDSASFIEPQPSVEDDYARRMEAVDPKWKGKGKAGAKDPGEASSPVLEDIPMIDPHTTTQPLPSLFALQEHLESSPTKKLKKKTFRKPITTPFELKYSPSATPVQAPLVRDVQVFPTNYEPTNYEAAPVEPEKKPRNSRVFGLFKHKVQPSQTSATQSVQLVQEPATFQGQSVENVTVTYPGPSQQVFGRNGFGYQHYTTEPESPILSQGTTLAPPALPKPQVSRVSISDSVAENALINMKLGDELAQGRHPASMEVPPEVQWELHQKNLQQIAQKQATDLQPQKPTNDTEANIIPGPFARRNKNRDFTPIPAMSNPFPAEHLIPSGLLPDNTNAYAPIEPLTPQKVMASGILSDPEFGSDPLYDAAVIRKAFRNSLQRNPTPPRGTNGSARAPQTNNETSPRARRPSTFKEQQAQANDSGNHVQFKNGQPSPSKTEASYRTAPEGQDRTPDSRPPSTYSHDSIGGDVFPYYETRTNYQRFERHRERTPPDNVSISSADFSSSTRPLDASAPAKFAYSSPRNSPRGAHLNKPSRVPSGPRVQPPDFSKARNSIREERYSRPSFTASELTRPTTTDTEDNLIMSPVVRTDVREIPAAVTANWVPTRRPVGQSRMVN